MSQEKQAEQPQNSKAGLAQESSENKVGKTPHNQENNAGCSPKSQESKLGTQAGTSKGQESKTGTPQEPQAEQKGKKKCDPQKMKNPYSEDGTWEEINGLNPDDPGYGIMLEELEWQRRRQRRYSLVLGFEVFFAVLIIGIIIYFIITSN